MHMIWPVSCPVCGAAGSLICSACLKGLLKDPQLSRCLWCGRTVPCGTHADDVAVRSGAFYGGDMRRVILMLKHGRYRALGPRLGKALAEVFPSPLLDVLFPVPLHRRSPRRYNQAEAIALGLGEAWGVEVWNAARWRHDVRSRRGMNAAGREALPQDAFEVDGNIAGLRVALVDDVCTTGSTLSRLGAACRERGAMLVGACVAAQAGSDIGVRKFPTGYDIRRNS
jgi:predicted amidophosphoribosyltransferase